MGVVIPTRRVDMKDDRYPVRLFKSNRTSKVFTYVQ
jgi:hypothetical protein